VGAMTNIPALFKFVFLHFYKANCCFVGLVSCILTACICSSLPCNNVMLRNACTLKLPPPSVNASFLMYLLSEYRIQPLNPKILDLVRLDI